VSELRFHVEAVWHGGRLGTGELKAGGLQTAISVPVEQGGPGVGTNPEELLIGAAMNCYIITLAAILEKRNFKVQSLTMKSEGILTVESGNLGFRQIVHRPTVVLAEGDEKTVEATIHAAYRAEQVCMISKAMRGNVEITVEPTVEIVNDYSSSLINQERS
jgi:peroxiredoxin-like protein